MTFVSVLLAAAVLAITPGPDMAHVVARSVAGGHAEGLAFCLGAAIGGLLHVAAAVLGLSLRIAQSAVAFEAIKLLGAAWRVGLGLRTVWQRDAPAPAGPAARSGPRRLVASGTAQAARARLLRRVSGATMVGLGAVLAFARREA